MTSENHILPHAPDIEMAALGSVLYTAPQDRVEAVKMLSQLRRTLFYLLPNQEVFGALYCLAVDGKDLDTLSVIQWLKEKNKIVEAGGLAYVSALPDKTPSAVLFEQQVATLREKMVRRELIEMAGKADLWGRDEAKDPAASKRQFTDMLSAATANSGEKREWLRFYTPTQCRDYIPQKDHILVGDCHIVRGVPSVVAGPPGIGKSRSALALAIAGANGPGASWMGLSVHCRFKTVIIQAENGRYRLKQEFGGIVGDHFDEFIRVCEPPEFGMSFGQADFCAYVTDFLAEFQPGLVVLDPWTSVAGDDAQKDYLAAWRSLRSVMPKGDLAPSLLIVAHTRKPREDARKMGRALLHDVAGSYVLVSVPRSVFVMLPFSDETTDDRIVWNCVKNNDGELGERTAWYRRNGLFVPCTDIDWGEFDATAKDSSVKITKQHMETLFQNGSRSVLRKTAIPELREATGCGHSAAYEALSIKGRFAEHLSEDGGLLAWTL